MKVETRVEKKKNQLKQDQHWGDQIQTNVGLFKLGSTSTSTSARALKTKNNIKHNTVKKKKKLWKRCNCTEIPTKLSYKNDGKSIENTTNEKTK